MAAIPSRPLAPDEIGFGHIRNKVEFTPSWSRFVSRYWCYPGKCRLWIEDDRKGSKIRSIGVPRTYPGRFRSLGTQHFLPLYVPRAELASYSLINILKLHLSITNGQQDNVYSQQDNARPHLSCQRRLAGELWQH